MDFSKVDKLIEDSLPEMERDLIRLIRFPSVESLEQAAPGAPFGPEVQGALDAMLDISRRLGLSTVDLDGYCGYADLQGESAETVGVLGHLDVVPVNATDWHHPPFAGEVENDRIYGRGAMDDKGPTIAALYGAKALVDAGLTLPKTVRFIYGCNEETGMLCMEHYLKCAEAPKSGFTPDADWPLVVGEKGILHYFLSDRWEAAGEGVRLTELSAGIASNVVPAAATALMAGLDSLPAVSEGITAEWEGELVRLTAKGTAAHASTPEDGDNALAKLLRYLAGMDFAPAGAKHFVDTVAGLTMDDKFGENMGIAGRDELSRTTHAPTVCHLDGQGASLTCDTRFRLSDTAEKYLDILGRVAAENGLLFTPDMYQNPLYLGADNPLAGQLLESYREVTGDNAEPLILGGGTYAKVMPGFLAFGPEAYDEPTRAHQADEFMTRRELVEAAKIYAHAIWRMAQ